MLSANKILFLCVAITILAYSYCATTSKNEALGFAEVEENENIKNKDNRQPVFMPSICQSNELYYPGDQKDDWICDCRPAYIYHPSSDLCWPTYEKGPCEDGQYLILPKNSDSVIPVCEKNPCPDKFVQYKGNCVKIGSTLACAHMYPEPAAIAVNATTLKVECQKVAEQINSRFGEDEEGPTSDACPLGSRRRINKMCSSKV